MKTVAVGSVEFSNEKPFTLIAGPCQIESRDHTLMLAEKIHEIADRNSIQMVFKASFDKANRSSISGARGIGIDEGLKILQEVKSLTGLPVITDIHEPNQASAVAQVVDILQIPAFLCRQTDLLITAGKTGKAVNIKKGQFLAPWDMKHPAQKVASTGNENILLCERGTSFGYNTLVNDYRGLPEMAKTGCPVVFDATHSVQQPGGLGGATGGDRTMVPVLARAALAVGVAAIFAEAHDDPNNAPSDGQNMLTLEMLAKELPVWKNFDELAKKGQAED